MMWIIVCVWLIIAIPVTFYEVSLLERGMPPAAKLLIAVFCFFFWWFVLYLRHWRK